MDFNYHSVPAPWLQIQLLRILSLLGKNEQRQLLLILALNSPEECG